MPKIEEQLTKGIPAIDEKEIVSSLNISNFLDDIVISAEYLNEKISNFLKELKAQNNASITFIKDYKATGVYIPNLNKLRKEISGCQNRISPERQTSATKKSEKYRVYSILTIKIAILARINILESLAEQGKIIKISEAFANILDSLILLLDSWTQAEARLLNEAEKALKKEKIIK